MELLSGFADQVFGRGAEGYAFASMTGSARGRRLLAAQRGQVTGLTSRVVLALLLLALALIGFAATNLFVFALLVCFTGFAVIVIGVGEQTRYRMQSTCDARPGDEPVRND